MTAQEPGQPRKALIHDHAAWWLADDNTLMVAPLDPATGAPVWALAHPADPMDHPEPDIVLGIHDSLIAAALTRGPVAVHQVLNPTETRPGYLVRDRNGADQARYDRLDLAQQAAAHTGGRIYAWGQIGHGPIGWHPLDLTTTTRRPTAAATTPTNGHISNPTVRL